jgi:hypothetical protein
MQFISFKIEMGNTHDRSIKYKSAFVGASYSRFWVLLRVERQRFRTSGQNGRPVAPGEIRAKVHFHVNWPKAKKGYPL